MNDVKERNGFMDAFARKAVPMGGLAPLRGSSKEGRLLCGLTCLVCFVCFVMPLLSGCSAPVSTEGVTSEKAQSEGVSTDSSEATGDSSSEDDGQSDEVSVEIDMDAMDFDYTERDKDPSFDIDSATAIEFDSDEATIKGDGAEFGDGVLSIAQEGAYLVSGELENGQILVEVSDQEKVQLVFDGAIIHNDDGPALYVKEADKVFVTLVEGSKNSLSDGTGYVSAEDDGVPDACLYSKADLTINGSGALDVTGASLHAVNSKDDLVITGGSITASAEGDALRGKDCVKIADGAFELKAGEDAIKSNNDEDGTRGFISIDGGDFSIEAGDDAVHAESVLVINDGDVEVATCTEGLEAERVYVKGGDVRVTATDDGVNASARETTVATSGEALAGQLPADAEAAGDGANQEGVGAMTGSVPQQPADPAVQNGGLAADSGMRGDAPSAFGGDAETPFDPNAQEQGIAAAPSDPSSAEAQSVETMPEEQGGAGEFGVSVASESCVIEVSGGRLLIDAGGDCLDTNGTMLISGGVVLARCTSSGIDSALDYEIGAQIDGGTVLLMGPREMAMGLTDGSQACVTSYVDGAAGDNVSVVDAEDSVLIALDAVSAFGWLCASTPQMEEGAELSVIIGGSPSDAGDEGFADSGGVSGGNESKVIAALPSANMGGGPMAQPGMQGTEMIKPE